MTIYLLKDYPEYAATSSADAVTLLTALADPGTETNTATIGRIMGKISPLVATDTGEPLVISSIDDTNGTVSSWVTDASTTLAVGLGDPDPNGNCNYASTLSFAISGSTRTATLALNTDKLQAAVSRGRMAPGQSMTLQLQVQKNTASVTETVGLLCVQVLCGLLGGNPVTQDSGSYVTTAAARAGYIINLSGVTSLTGGGATTLDGQAAGGASFPVGCAVATSDSIATTGFRLWKLVSGTLAATNLANFQVKPTNYATSNPMYWQG